MCIKANENRDIAEMDIHGPFLHPECDEDVVMKFMGHLAEFLVLRYLETYQKYAMVYNESQ